MVKKNGTRTATTKKMTRSHSRMLESGLKHKRVYLQLQDKISPNQNFQVSEDTFVIVKITYDTVIGLI
jgi:hypothetical protein